MEKSAQYLQQIEQMGEKPDFRKQIVNAYKDPVLKPLTEERAKIESQYLPSMFNSFIGGTGASDMSPAAKLAQMGSSLGRITSRAQNNQDIQNFYDNQIGQLAQGFNQDYANRMNRLQGLYNMQFQREQAEEARRARAAAQAQSQMNLSAIEDYINKLRGGAQNNNLDNLSITQKPPGIIRNFFSKHKQIMGAESPLDKLNAYRNMAGMSPVQSLSPSSGLASTFSNVANTALNLAK